MKSDSVLIIPWDLRDEITLAAGHVRESHGKFVVSIRQVRTNE